MRCRGAIVVVLALLFGAGLAPLSVAQEDDSEDDVEDISFMDEVEEVSPSTSRWFPDQYPKFERANSLLLGKSTRESTLLFVIGHRNRQSFQDDPIDDWFGFDSGSLKVAMGLRYGILETLDIGVLRVNGTIEVFDTYEVDARYQLLNQEDAGLDLAIRPGYTWFRHEDSDDSSAFFGQILASRQFGPRVILGTGALYHDDSSGPVKSVSDDSWSAAVQALAEFRLTPTYSWNIESAFNVGGYSEDNPYLSTGLKIVTNRHTFAIVVSNSQYTSADSVVANSFRSEDDLILGFSITREIEL